MLHIKTMVFYGKLEESAVFCWSGIRSDRGDLTLPFHTTVRTVRYTAVHKFSLTFRYWLSMDGYPSLASISFDSTAFSIPAALHVPFRQFAILCACQTSRCSARSMRYRVRTRFHCFQYTARILWRSHSSVCFISCFMSASLK